MNSTIKCIIFDFGNVLVQWDPYSLYKRFLPSPAAVDSFLHEVNFTEWNAKQDAGRPFKEGVAELSAQFPQYAHLIQAYDTHWEESIVGVISGTVNILRDLKSKGWPLYLLSNFSAEKFPLMQKNYDFVKLFDDMIISGEVGLIKPDPAIFHLTLSRINHPAGECLFIDDSLPNIQTARAVGMQAIHFQNPDQLQVELNRVLYN
jgi:2-haloacid dehalogenase